MSMEGKGPTTGKKREVRKVTLYPHPGDPNPTDPKLRWPGTKIESHLTTHDELRQVNGENVVVPIVERRDSARAVWTLKGEGEHQTVSFVQPVSDEFAASIEVPVLQSVPTGDPDGRTAEVIIDNGTSIPVALTDLRAAYRARRFAIARGQEIISSDDTSYRRREPMPVATVKRMEDRMSAGPDDGGSYEEVAEFSLYPLRMVGEYTKFNGTLVPLTHESSRDADADRMREWLEAAGNTLQTTPVTADQKPVLIKFRNPDAELDDRSEDISYYLSNGKNLPIERRSSL